MLDLIHQIQSACRVLWGEGWGIKAPGYPIRKKIIHEERDV